jgi:hypothetical protein
VDTALSLKGESFVFLGRCVIKHRVTPFSVVEDFTIIKQAAGSFSALENALHESLFLRLGLVQTQVAADACLHLIIGNVGALHKDLLSHHDRRRDRQAQFKIVVGLAPGLGL